MRTAHLPAADVYRRDDDLFRRDMMQQQAHCADIGYGVHCAKLVEVNLCHGHTMHMAFCQSKAVINGEYVPSDLLRQL